MCAFRSYGFPLGLGLLTCAALVIDSRPPAPQKEALSYKPYREGDEWAAPDVNTIPFDAEGEMIRYGRELITNTAVYLGPKGSVATLTNGNTCQSCHTYGGTQNFGNPFSAVASTYPRYRDRSGRMESIEFRINDCMQRSLNGKPLDSTSAEMQAMVAYIKWVGSGVPQGVRPNAAGTETLLYLARAADPEKGKGVFLAHCVRCHGADGQGLLSPDGGAYVYPPLWGNHSYNTGAGIHRLSLLAGLIKNNMPFGINWKAPELTTEEAWDVAAFIAAQPRPKKTFADWKDLSKKPVDYPFGPYADAFSEQQHKYGPFGEMKR